MLVVALLSGVSGFPSRLEWAGRQMRFVLPGLIGGPGVARPPGRRDIYQALGGRPKGAE
jgi:hypothetical protein